MPQIAEEVESVAGGREIEPQAAPGTAREVLEVALTGQTDQAVGRQRAGAARPP
jgi:hypothetical protein